MENDKSLVNNAAAKQDEVTRLSNVVNEIEVHLISIADGVAPADAVQRAFDVINRERRATIYG